MDTRYEFAGDAVYCYPGSSVLKNKLNIREEQALSEAEREITALRIAQALAHPIAGKFDASHLKRIHRFLFADIYAWAGKTRTVNISKGTLFCLCSFIDENLDSLFSQLRLEKFLASCEIKAALASRLSYYLAGINAIHPFRDGNGRAQRMFIGLLASARGYHLNYDLVTTEEMLAASIASFQKDYGPLDALMLRSLEKAEG